MFYLINEKKKRNLVMFMFPNMSKLFLLCVIDKTGTYFLRGKYSSGTKSSNCWKYSQKVCEDDNLLINSTKTLIELYEDYSHMNLCLTDIWVSFEKLCSVMNKFDISFTAFTQI